MSDLSKELIRIGRTAKNITISAFSHPLELTILDAEGRIAEHRKPEEQKQQSDKIIPLYQRMYLVTKASLTHPFETSYINFQTGDIYRE